MKSMHNLPFNLSDYDISPERGFLPEDPLKDLPNSPEINFVGEELPKLLVARAVRRFIDEQFQQSPVIPQTWQREHYKAAMRILSFASHAYVWEIPDRPAPILPP